MNQLKLRCPHCEREIVLRVDPPNVEPRPSATPWKFVDKPINELAFQGRAYSALISPADDSLYDHGAGLTHSSPASAILKQENCELWFNFGKLSFIEIIAVLHVELGWPLEYIQRSVFWRTAPSLYRSGVIVHRTGEVTERFLAYVERHKARITQSAPLEDSATPSA